MLTATAMCIELRPYQEESIRRLIAAYQQDWCGSELLVLPTGAGKTIIFAHFIDWYREHVGFPVLIIAHRDELLDQAADKYRMIRPEAVIGKVGSGLHEYGGEVTVASVATISRPEHIKRLKLIKFGLVIVDEAHHSAAKSYQDVLEAIPGSFKVFMTATPDRLDNKPLLDGKEPLYIVSILDMIEQGYLCDIKAIAIRTETSLDDLHTEMGDYKLSELERAVDTPARNKRVVDGYLEHASGRRAICFGVTVRHASNLVDTFNRAGVHAALVSGETPLEQRRAYYKALRAGTIKVLCSVQVLGEGFDEPLVECVIIARPTQSRTLYMQAIGRGLRIAPGKENCIILDLTDNCFKHRLEPQALRKVLGKAIRDNESVLEAVEREKREGGATTIVRKLKETRKEDITIDLRAWLTWQERANGMYVLEVGAVKHRIALVPVDDFSYAVWARLAPEFEAQLWLPSAPLDWAQSFAEREARKLLADPKAVQLVDRNAPWRSRPASEKQIALLERFEVPVPRDADGNVLLTMGEASELLDPIFEMIHARKQAGQEASV